MIINIGYLEHAPAGFHGMAVHNADDSYTVLLDPNDTHEQRLKTLKHELDHINNDDFRCEDIQKIEARAHNGESIQTKI